MIDRQTIERVLKAHRTRNALEHVAVLGLLFLGLWLIGGFRQMMLNDDTRITTAVVGAIWTIFDSTLFAAFLGRAYWHLRLVMKGERKLLGSEALIEPILVGIGYQVGMSFAHYMGFDHTVTKGLVLIISYLGPDGFQAIINKYLQGSPKQ